MNLTVLNRKDDLPVAFTYVLVKESDKTFPSNRLEKVGNREQDGVEHRIGEFRVPVAEFLLFSSKNL